MSFAVILCVVLLAVYGLTSLLLSVVVAAFWHGLFQRAKFTSRDYLALRLIPSAGALLLVLTVALPAFITYEPAQDREQVGPLLFGLDVLAAIAIGAGVWRALRASMAAGALLRNFADADRWSSTAGRYVAIGDVREPIVAAVGAWRPQIIAARSVFAACSLEEFQQVIAHAAAQLSTRDHLKLLLIIASPDMLAWLSAGETLKAQWRAAAASEADERATGPDRQKRLALASALVKLARLSIRRESASATLNTTIALDHVDGRVSQLLAPTSNSVGTVMKPLMLCTLLLPVFALPLHHLVQEFEEVMVSLGR
jgi:hypothetical protein